MRFNSFGRDKGMDQLIDDLAASQYRYGASLKDYPSGQRLLEADREAQRHYILEAISWLRKRGGNRWASGSRLVDEAARALLRRNLPFSHDDLLALLQQARLSQYWDWRPGVLTAVERYRKEQQQELAPALREGLEQLLQELQSSYQDSANRRLVARLQTLLGLARPRLPLVPGDVWAETASAELSALDEPLQSAWSVLLAHCAQATGSAPSARWLSTARGMVDVLGAASLKQALLRWLPLVDQAPPQAAAQEREPWDYGRLRDQNVDVLRGLAWLCAGREDAELARALAAMAISAYRKRPGIGPRCPRLGNACIWSLGAMPGRQGIAQLALLKTRLRQGSAQKVIETALATAAERAGLAQEQVEELLAPTCGLEQVGLRREELGELAVELAVTGTRGAELRWLRDGRPLKSAPREAKAQHGELLRELLQAAADIKRLLPAQRDRIESLYLTRTRWPLAAWRERYLEHPLVGTLARRLIWTFHSGARQQTGIWHAGQIVGSDGQALDGLDEQTHVELWHPLHSSTAEVLAWREWLAAHELRQPFKQAHREIYLLTDAERATRVYSNRFAAHILRQHQFNALCGARGWRNQLRLMVDDSYPPASRLLPAWDLRAEFWIEGIGDNYGADTNETGTYLRVSTDQVRFYPIEARQHMAHAGGGGYELARYGAGRVLDPLPLEQIPALVFSEIMRDVDLFVGVASVGNDPTWSDGGPEGRFRDYWTSYSFGELSETARTRKQVLERLIPRLKLASRCTLTERFLVVRGDLRTYKIHLGSGNILMEPDDQYLCIVPARGAADADGDGKVLLPFEGDGTLAIILSKAFLLADDRTIKDPTIVRQIQR